MKELVLYAITVKTNDLVVKAKKSANNLDTFKYTYYLVLN